MERENFDKCQTLQEIYDELIDYLTQKSYVTIKDGNTEMYISENGGSSFWFDDLVAVILEKTYEADGDIVEVCQKNNIKLFEVTKNIKKK